MVTDGHRRGLGALLPVASALIIGLVLSFGAATYVDRQIDEDAQRAFDRDAAAATAEIEREIERHVGVIDELAAFSAATWPGELDEWRAFTAGRVTGGTFLAFSSTAGFIERVPVDDLEAMQEREARSTGMPFEVNDIFPLGPNADRLVLTRTGEDFSGDVLIRGLEVSAATAVLGVELPGTGDGLAVAAADTAPEAVLDLFSIDTEVIVGNDIINTNVILARAVGEEGEEPLGWVVVPAELGYLLTNAIGDLDRSGLNIAIGIPDIDIEGDLGRYEGDSSVALADAGLSTDSAVQFGGWEWKVTVWSAENYGIGANRIHGWHVLLGGIVASLVVALALETRRNHSARLKAAEFETELHRTLAETDPLTGLLNRKGLSSFGRDESVVARIESEGGATFFLDLDGFKLINDRKGHAAGDSILVSVARAISDAARDDDVVGRIGGDEFVLVCPGLSDEVVAETIASRMSGAINRISDPAPVDVSIGVALTRPGTSFSFDGSLAAADAAMYAAKNCEDDQAAAKLVIAPGSNESVSSSRS